VPFLDRGKQVLDPLASVTGQPMVTSADGVAAGLPAPTAAWAAATGDPRRVATVQDMPPADHLLVVASNFERPGGLEAHLAELYPRVAAEGITTTLVYLGHRPTPRHVDAVQVIKLRRRADFRDVLALPDPAEWRRFVRAAQAGELPGGPITAVATHTRFFPMSALGARLAHRLRVPLVHTEHGGGFVVSGTRAVEVASRAVDVTLGRWVLRRADRVVAVSEESATFVQSLAGVQSTVVPNGIDVDRWLPKNDHVPTPRPLVFVGRVVAEKGWRDFLDVAAATREATGVDRPVHVVGDGPDVGEAQAHAARLGLPARWHGRLDAERIRPLLAGAVYVNPSVAAEGFQLTQLEALVAGAALVSYDVGVARELERAGVGDVVVVPQGDLPALTRATRDAAARPPVLPTRADVLPWDWESVARRYAAVVRAAAADTPAP
jgi:glycosyltransferase involved in cell wall biosynthesis